MSLERTLSIVKPDGVQKNVIGNVYHRFEQAGLRIVAARMMRLTQAQAEAFYGVHPRAGILQGPRRVHDFRPGHGAGARRRGRRAEEP
jgi:nucleoside diphosphate kinase